MTFLEERACRLERGRSPPLFQDEVTQVSEFQSSLTDLQTEPASLQRKITPICPAAAPPPAPRTAARLSSARPGSAYATSWPADATRPPVLTENLQNIKEMKGSAVKEIILQNVLDR